MKFALKNSMKILWYNIKVQIFPDFTTRWQRKTVRLCVSVIVDQKRIDDEYVEACAALWAKLICRISQFWMTTHH
jgi:hypothetical protein